MGRAAGRTYGRRGWLWTKNKKVRPPQDAPTAFRNAAYYLREVSGGQAARHNRTTGLYSVAITGRPRGSSGGEWRFGRFGRRGFWDVRVGDVREHGVGRDALRVWRSDGGVRCVPLDCAAQTRLLSPRHLCQSGGQRGNGRPGGGSSSPLTSLRRRLRASVDAHMAHSHREATVGAA